MAENKKWNLAVLPGDGIGPEIMDCAKEVLEEINNRGGPGCEYTEYKIGGAALDAYGVPLRDEDLEKMKKSDAVLLAAIGGPKWDTGPAELRPEAGLLGLRKGLGAFANLRPAKIIPSLVSASSLKEDIAKDVDVLVVRELTGGIYFGEPRGRFGDRESGTRSGFNTMIYTEPEIRRIAKVAFEAAHFRKGKVMSVDKANVLIVSQVWREVVNDVHKEYPDIALDHMYVDNAAMQLVRNPGQFDVILTGNLFGDILSDISAELVGSIGMLPSASLSDSRPGLFEPVHGSAPDISGQGKANPLAMILSVAMMFRYSFDDKKTACSIENAVDRTLESGARTMDLGGKMGTREIMDRVMNELKVEELV